MPENADRLRPAQRRRLEVVLSRVLALARELDGLRARTAPAGTSLEPMEDDLPPGFVGRAPEIAERIRLTAAPLVEWLEIVPEPHSLRRHLTAVAIVAAINVEDSGSRGLRGYGTVDPADAARIDPVIDQLRRLLYQIAAQVSGDPPSVLEERSDARIQG